VLCRVSKAPFGIEVHDREQVARVKRSADRLLKLRRSQAKSSNHTLANSVELFLTDL
jgi:hypothetical protein